MKITTGMILFSCFGFLNGCATTPNELISARQAYSRASHGPAATLAPAELHKAKEALSKAEHSAADEPSSPRTRDLSYVAERSAQMAEVTASILSERAKVSQAGRDTQAIQGEIIHRAKMGMNEALAKLAAVKVEKRGLVITLSGSVLFPSNNASLLPSAKTRLDEIADALLEAKDRTLIVEGHADSQGSHRLNQALSQRRAEVVRSHLISRGYPAQNIEAHGIGKDRPIANNASAEGRANNRRVEIVVGPETR